MNRKLPLKTYQRKKTGQSSFSYSQPSLWEPRSFSKRISTNGKKNKPLTPQGCEDVEDMGSGYLETTFDRIAKNVRLPPPPLQESRNSSINISSDVPCNELSPIKIDAFEFPWARETSKSRARHKAKRKPVQSRTVYVEPEVVVKKRLKQDLINTSTKKDKAVRSSRRKVSAQTGKSLINGKDKQEIHGHGVTVNSPENWFVEKRRKKKNDYLLRKKENVRRISSSSSNISDSGNNRDVDINKVKTKTKKKNIVSRRKAGKGKLKILESIDTSLKEFSKPTKFTDENRHREKKDCLESINKINSSADGSYSVNNSRNSTVSYRTRSKAASRNFSGSDYVSNFRKYSASKLGENNDLESPGFNKYKRILTKKQYTTKTQSKLTGKNNTQKPTDALDGVSDSKIQDLAIKPCSVVLLKCNENNNPVSSGKESEQVPHNYGMHSSEDLFPTSISNLASNIELETNDAIKMRLQESADTEQVQSVKSQSDFVGNLDLDVNPTEVKFTEENIDRKEQSNENWSLHYLKCSTPICARIKIDKTINFLSPIIANVFSFQENREFVDEKEVSKSSAGNSRVSKECLDLPQTITRRRSVRKKLNISYKEDKLSEMSNEYSKENGIKKIESNVEKMLSPTSQIQESLEILKLNLENSVNKYNTDKIGRNRLSQKEIFALDNNGSGQILESTNEFTAQSKDSCSQLTPVGIITTRSGRQLKLSMTTQKKFFNDSNDSEINPDTDNEIIDNSDTERNINLRSWITKHRGSRLTVLNARSKRSTSSHGKNSGSADMLTARNNYSAKIRSAQRISEVQTSNNSMPYESMNLNSPKNLNSTPVHSYSECSTQDYKKESRFNYSASVPDDEGTDTSTSDAVGADVADPLSDYTGTSNQEILQGVMESTENFNSLNINSHVEVKAENPLHSVNNDYNSESEWSTISSSENVNWTTSNLENEIPRKSYEENKLTNSSSGSSNNFMISNQSKLDDDFPITPSDNTSKFNPYQSPKYTDIALTDRLKLLSTRINTRKHRKAFSKPAATNISQAFEEQTATQTSDHSKSTNLFDVCSKSGFGMKEDEVENVAPTLEKPEDSKVFVQPLYVDLNRHLQPLVMIEKLEEDPLRITKNQSRNWHVPLTAIHETSNETLRTINEEANDSFTSNESNVNEDHERFVKSDPLYCPPELFEADNSSFKPDITTMSPSDGNFSKLDLERQSLLASFHQCLLRRSEQENKSLKANQSVSKRSKASLHQCPLRRSEQENKSLKANQSVPKRSKKTGSSLGASTSASKTNTNISKLDLSEQEAIGRRSLFLKPGKDWARSLSILQNIEDGSDLEVLSNGKGKRWRKSVQTIIAMQDLALEYSKSLSNNQNVPNSEQTINVKAKNWRKSVEKIIAIHEDRVVESCLGKNQDGKARRSCFRTLDHASIPNTPCLGEQSIGSASPGRFIKRMSIRVIPDKKKLSQIGDISFLEAYGIATSKSRKTLSRSSEFESGEKIQIHDLQCQDTVNETAKTEQIATARDVVLQRCSQEDYLLFAECFPAEYLDNCRKIGEGVYGEVFLYESRRHKSVIKIIPIEGDAVVNGERQKRFDEILSEIVIAKELHNLRYGNKHRTHGFVEVKNIRCIKGKYPEKLIDLWKAYDNDKESENDCPSMFDQDQLYIVLELGHGGEDLEAFVFPSAVEAHGLFIQTAFALAVAEQSLEFEHRDLHWGNVLISETKATEVSYKLNNKEYTYPTKGLQVAIIDFTLSRMSYDGCCIFNDLAQDPALFIAQGEYQFEIYRLMRDKVGDDWQKFEPYTNILWLHYTIDKMMSSLRYKRKYAKEHREAMYLFHELKEVVLNYESAFDFVTNCEKITSFRCDTASDRPVKPIEVESHDRK